MRTAALRSEFKKFLGDKEIFKFLKDISEESQKHSSDH